MRESTSAFGPWRKSSYSGQNSYISGQDRGRCRRTAVSAQNAPMLRLVRRR